jgi:hypothetical protein
VPRDWQDFRPLIMRVFLSYAGEQRTTADSVALRLRQAGHDVFFDKDDLPAAASFDDRIRQGLERSDTLVFLVGPESVAPGAYTLTEMQFARERWPNPSGRVLPVMVAPTPYTDIPEYLKAVTVLEPKGNLVAETAAAVERLAQAPRRRRLVAVALTLALLVAGGVGWRAWGPRPGPARSVNGTVSDVTTGSAVAGATLEMRCGIKTLGQGLTDDAGKFELALASCREEATLSVRHESYTGHSRRVGDESEITIDLLPKALGGCVLKDTQGIVVGHFRAPVSATAADGDLAGRIADALTYDVLTIVQTLNMPPALQPRFLACDEANPRSMEFAEGYARALKADALIVGSIEPVDGAFNVRAFIGDAFQLFKPPVPSMATGVALNDPAVAKLGPDMHAAILTAVARGYAERRMFSECIDVAVAAGRLLSRSTSALDQTLARCQDGTGLADLRRGG